MFSYLSPEERVPADHPLRPIRQMTDAVLERLSPRFDRLYSDIGRPSIPPEKLLRALLLQVLYTVRSERLLMEQLQYNLLFRWFVGLSMDDPVWDATTFTQESRPAAGRRHRGGVLSGSAGRGARGAGLLSDEHFTVDGTLLEAWASQKSFRRRTRRRIRPDDPGQSDREFPRRGRGRTTRISRRPIRTRACTRSRAGSEAKLAYLGHLLTENRHGLIVDALVTRGDGDGGTRRGGGDAWRCCPTAVASRSAATRTTTRATSCARLRAMGVTPHVAQYPETRAAAARSMRRTTRHPGYAISQRKRKLVEQAFGWMKTVGMPQAATSRRPRVNWNFIFTAAAYNLVRMRTLLAQPRRGRDQDRSASAHRIEP